MTIIEKFKSLLTGTTIDTKPDNEEYNIELHPGLTGKTIDELVNQLPAGKIPEDLDPLLRFTKGFEFYGLEEVTFDGLGEFGFEHIFPHSIQLGHDGSENYWILDMDATGNWGTVFYVCHDPAVIVKHSDGLLQFMQHIDEHEKDRENSTLTIIHDKTVFEIWEKESGFTSLKDARSSDDPILKNFARSLPDHFLVADLRNKPNQSGFAWGKFGSNVDNAQRCKDALIWGIEKPQKKGFFSQMLG
jgi:hypothetical protein